MQFIISLLVVLAFPGYTKSKRSLFSDLKCNVGTKNLQLFGVNDRPNQMTNCRPGTPCIRSTAHYNGVEMLFEGCTDNYASWLQGFNISFNFSPINKCKYNKLNFGSQLGNVTFHECSCINKDGCNTKETRRISCIYEIEGLQKFNVTNVSRTKKTCEDQDICVRAESVFKNSQILYRSCSKDFNSFLISQNWSSQYDVGVS
uniref:Secreted protein n=1 Tax=Rhabditophanes sp. KR3021 TaxID=114890 RepID=A0AC35UAV7_9BILA